MSAELTMHTIGKALHRMAEIAKDEGIAMDVMVYGGAVMVMDFQSRMSTFDIDVKIIGDKSKFFHLSVVVGEEMGLDPGWINHGVSAFVSKDEKSSVFFQDGDFTIRTASPEYMLAMKALSLRSDSHDAEDVEFLVRQLGISDIEEIVDITLSPKNAPTSPRWRDELGNRISRM